jgi:hypothetical protein
VELTADTLEALPVGGAVKVAPRQTYTKTRQGNPAIKHYDLTVWLKNGSSHGFKTTAELLIIAAKG